MSANASGSLFYLYVVHRGIAKNSVYSADQPGRYVVRKLTGIFLALYFDHCSWKKHSTGIASVYVSVMTYKRTTETLGE